MISTISGSASLPYILTTSYYLPKPDTTAGVPLTLTAKLDRAKAERVLQDAAAYQALLDRVETLEGIQRGVADVKAGRTRPAQQVFARLRRKHGVPR